MTKPINTLYPVAVESQVREWASEQKHWFPYYVHGKCSTGACWWTLRLSQRTANSFSFICYFICFVCWLTCVNQGGECVRKLLRHCGGKTRHMIWELNFARGSRVCIVVRSRRADQVYRLIVQGHVSEKSFSWAFHEHWSFFAETYSLNGAESKKSCLQFFQSHLGLFYGN